MITKRDINFCEEMLGCKFTEWQRLYLRLMFCAPSYWPRKMYCSGYNRTASRIVNNMEFINHVLLPNAIDGEKKETNK